MKPKPEYARDRDMPDTFTTPLIVSDEKGRRFINKDKFGENFFALRLDNYPLQVPPSSKVLSGFSVPEEAGHSGDFEVSAIVGMGTAPFLVNMSEVGIEANAFSNNAIHHNLFAGAGGLPFVLAETAFFIAGRFVQVEVTNLSSSMTAAVRLALLGRKFNADMPPDQLLAATTIRVEAALGAQDPQDSGGAMTRTRGILAARRAEYARLRGGDARLTCAAAAG